MDTCEERYEQNTANSNFTFFIFWEIKSPHRMWRGMQTEESIHHKEHDSAAATGLQRQGACAHRTCEHLTRNGNLQERRRCVLCRERKFKNQQETAEMPRTLPQRDRHKLCWEHMTRTGKPQEYRKCKDCRQQAVAEKQTAVLLAAALGNNDAEMCGNHQVGTEERECHLDLQVDPTNQDHALHGGKWTVSHSRQSRADAGGRMAAAGEKGI